MIEEDVIDKVDATFELISFPLFTNAEAEQVRLPKTVRENVFRLRVFPVTVRLVTVTALLSCGLPAPALIVTLSADPGKPDGVQFEFVFQRLSPTVPVQE